MFHQWRSRNKERIKSSKKLLEVQIFTSSSKEKTFHRQLITNIVLFHPLLFSSHTRRKYILGLAKSKSLFLQTKNSELLYTWRFPRYSAPIHWLVYGHMTSDNEISVDRCCTSFVSIVIICFPPVWPICFAIHNDWSLGKQWILFSSNLNVSSPSTYLVSENIEILGKQIRRSPRDQSLRVKYLPLFIPCQFTVMNMFWRS